MVRRGDDVALETSRSQASDQVDAPARRVGDGDLGMGLRKRRLDLREGGKEAARVAHVQLVTPRL